MIKRFSLVSCFLAISSVSLLCAESQGLVSDLSQEGSAVACPQEELRELKEPRGLKGEQGAEEKKADSLPKGRARAGRQQRARLLYFNHLIMERYDENKNGRLDEPELEALKKDAQSYQEQRKQELLARFDENKNGILEKEEMQKAHETLRAEMHAHLNRLRASSQPQPPSARTEDNLGAEKEENGLKPLPSDPQKKPRAGRPSHAAHPLGSQKGLGLNAPVGGPPEGRGPAARGMGRLPHFMEGLPPEAVMVFNIVGHELVKQKFDLDKDGKLSESEREKMDAHKREFFDTLRKHREKRRQEAPSQLREECPSSAVLSE